ncbi:MAG: bifunctional enoyl-CoA hydratase/phosphate acetyltransferase [Thermotogae bacterium]|nr:bifunctional enoyl-CoA hydratase/phosphate acetyltransferase [Thermotogota bacterium]
MIKNFEELSSITRSLGKITLGLVGAEDIEAIKAVKNAKDNGIVDAYLIGKREMLEKNMEILGIKPSEFECIDASTQKEASEIGVKLVSGGKAQMIMKGLVKTSILLKEVLNEEYGLRTGRILSHVVALQIPTLDRLLFLTDGGMIIKPTLEQKVKIINNAVEVARRLGIDKPKVACLAAVEVVNPAIDDTIDCAILAKMNARGQIKGCVVDGPLALDNALSERAAKIKKISSPVAGNADILVVPDITSGNLLGKSVVYFADGVIAGIVVGAKAPIVIVSRADTAKSKYYSLCLGAIFAHKSKKEGDL